MSLKKQSRCNLNQPNWRWSLNHILVIPHHFGYSRMHRNNQDLGPWYSDSPQNFTYGTSQTIQIEQHWLFHHQLFETIFGSTAKLGKVINLVAPDLESTQQYIYGITISFILDNISCFSKILYLYLELYIATLMPYLFNPSWQSGYAAWKKSAYLIISVVVWGSIPHLAFCFWLAKVPSHKVHMNSLRSPHRVLEQSD